MVLFRGVMGVKRGVPLPKAIERALSLVDQASVTGLAQALKVSTDRASELMAQLRAYGLITVKDVYTGRRGHPLKRASLTLTGRHVLELLGGRGAGVELRPGDLPQLLNRALERCRSCRSTEPLDETCALVASYAHLLGLDWERGVPVCSCRRLPKLKKSWRELVSA